VPFSVVATMFAGGALVAVFASILLYFIAG
jgi:hypothetical protein